MSVATTESKLTDNEYILSRYLHYKSVCNNFVKHNKDLEQVIIFFTIRQ